MSGEVITKGIIGETYEGVNVSATANTNIAAAVTTPTLEQGWITIEITPTLSGIFSVMRTKGTTTVKQKMNQGVALQPGASYSFSVESRRGETYNFQYSVTDTILALYITEVR